MRALGSGDPDRKAILDALRIPVQKDLRQRVKFDVVEIRRASSYAAVSAFAVQPDGSDVDYGKIAKYSEQVATGDFEPGIDALLRKKAGRWRVLRWVVGPTDVRTESWAAQYGAPAGLWSALPPE